MLRKIHNKMISIFGKNYSLGFNSICMGLMFTFLSLGYEDSTKRKVELILAIFLILNGVFWLIHSYRIACMENDE